MIYSNAKGSTPKSWHSYCMRCLSNQTVSQLLVIVQSFSAVATGVLIQDHLSSPQKTSRHSWCRHSNPSQRAQWQPVSCAFCKSLCDPCSSILYNASCTCHKFTHCCIHVTASNPAALVKQAAKIPLHFFHFWQQQRQRLGSESEMLWEIRGRRAEIPYLSWETHRWHASMISTPYEVSRGLPHWGIMRMGQYLLESLISLSVAEIMCQQSSPFLSQGLSALTLP